MKIWHYIHKLWIGLRLRCPVCEQGHMFNGLFKMDATCSHCGARFERLSGESIGGTLINLCVAEVLSVGGFIITELAFHPSLAFQLTFWTLFNIIFIVLFYRHARGLWVSMAYLAGGVYSDDAPDSMRKP